MDAATHCHSVNGLRDARSLFEQLLHDEEKHIDFLETQIEFVAKIGLELYPSVISENSARIDALMIASKLL